MHVEEPDAQNDAGELLLHSLSTSSFEKSDVGKENGWNEGLGRNINLFENFVTDMLLNLCLFAMTVAV